jgi:hypothetical protein
VQSGKHRLLGGTAVVPGPGLGGPLHQLSLDTHRRGGFGHGLGRQGPLVSVAICYRFCLAGGEGCGASRHLRPAWLDGVLKAASR